MSTVRPDDQDTTQTANPQPTFARREILRRAGIGTGALALAGVATATPALARSLAPALVRSRPHVTLGWLGASCEAPLYMAYQKGFFAAEGLDVELVNMGGTYDTPGALSSGKLDGAPGILFTWLKPIEQGADIRITAGLHGNCLRLVIAKNAGIKKAADFKGKTIAVGALGDSAMSFFSLLLAENGVDPLHDVSWKVYPYTALGTAFDKGDAVAAAAPDPFAYTLILQGKAIQVGTNLVGLFGNTAGITTHKYCCAPGISGKMVRDQPKVAAAVTRAWLKGSRYAGNHTHETSVVENSHKYVALPQSVIEKLLNTYLWIPSATGVKEDIYIGARNFKITGLLDPNTDPNKLAATAYVDIFKLAGEAVPVF